MSFTGREAFGVLDRDQGPFRHKKAPVGWPGLGL